MVRPQSKRASVYADCGPSPAAHSVQVRVAEGRRAMPLPSSSIRGAQAVGSLIRGGLGAALVLCGCAAAIAQPIPSGVTYLTGSQASDGSWPSSQVRTVLATTEALRALQVLSAAPASRAAAVARLEEDPVEDTDDRARRILV